MLPKVSLLVTTYNHRDNWEFPTLLASINKQSDQDFELVIVDDNSTDGTLDVLKEIFAKPVAYKIKILTHHKKRELKIQGNAIPYNIAFKYATGDIFVGLDDDGWIDEDLVVFVKSRSIFMKSTVVYGQVEYHKEFKGDLLDEYDRRVNLFKEQHHLGEFIGIKPRHCYGGIYACASEVIKKMGGHELVYQRSADMRFGVRLAKMVNPYFCRHIAMRFHHLGLSWYKQMRKEGRMKEVIANVINPTIHSYTIEPIVNGGMEFWNSDWFNDVEVIL